MLPPHADRPVPFLEGKYAELRPGIGCERCHGPGARHVNDRRAAVRTDSGYDKTIVNPARLPLARRLDVCEQCHVHTAVAVLREGRHAFSYLPSEPLRDQWAFFKVSGSIDNRIPRGPSAAERVLNGDSQHVATARVCNLSQPTPASLRLQGATPDLPDLPPLCRSRATPNALGVAHRSRAIGRVRELPHARCTRARRATRYVHRPPDLRREGRVDTTHGAATRRQAHCALLRAGQDRSRGRRFSGYG
jgi:hypothetical protein